MFFFFFVKCYFFYVIIEFNIWLVDAVVENSPLLSLFTNRVDLNEFLPN